MFGPVKQQIANVTQPQRVCARPCLSHCGTVRLVTSVILPSSNFNLNKAVDSRTNWLNLSKSLYEPHEKPFNVYTFCEESIAM